MSLEAKTLVLGGAGFIGSQFVRCEEAAGRKVLVYDALTYAGHPENLTGTASGFIRGDIGDGALVAQTLREFQPTWVVNFAAESHVDRSIDSPATFIETNLRGTFTLLNCALAYYRDLDSAKQDSFRYLQVSTDEVYGALGPTGAFTEATPYAPNSPYSASKAGGDHLVRAWHRTYGLPALVTHCSNNYGPRQFPEKLIPHMIFSALAERPLPVYGDGQQVRDWIHVEDHCKGITLALERGKVGESYCFGGAAERANLNVVQTICATLDQMRPRKRGPYKELIAFVTDRLGHDRRYAIDDTKAQRDLGFTRSHSFDQGLVQTIQWYLDNTEWCDSVQKKSK